MDDYIPEDPIPPRIFESLIEIIRVPNWYDITVLTAPPSFFSPTDYHQPVVTGFAGNVYVLFNERLISRCEDEEPRELCACLARDIALNLGRAYFLQHQDGLGPRNT